MKYFTLKQLEEHYASVFPDTRHSEIVRIARAEYERLHPEEPEPIHNFYLDIEKYEQERMLSEPEDSYTIVPLLGWVFIFVLILGGYFLLR